jgi:hypothetical protein
MFVDKGITKENLDYYLKELAKEFRKRNGKNTPAEIVLVGGAAILANYGFREMTYDIEAVITASSAMKEAVNTVGERLGLANGWLNVDFKNTSSYSPKLSQYSKYYRTYSNVLNIRTISAEYLVAMKLMSGRRYKKDLADIIGILGEQEGMGESLSYQQIDCAVKNLYGRWDNISEYAIQVLKAALDSENLKELFMEQEREETLSKQVVLQVQKYEEEKVKESNINEIIQRALSKRNNDRDAR